jgi:transcriptional regulator with XRE-family HTH domain
MTGIDLKELGKKNPKLARARAIVAAVNSGAKAMRDFRKKSGYSQAQMAAKLGVTQPRIAQLESGKPGNAPSLEQLADAAFLAGTELLVGDRSQIAGPSEDEALLEKSRSTEARVRELVKRVEGVSASERDADWVVDTARRKPEALLLLAAGCALMMRSGGLQTLPVPKRTLKELARSLEESANEAETTKAYDVLTRVSEAIGTTLPVVAPPPKSRRDRQKDR